MKKYDLIGLDIDDTLTTFETENELYMDAFPGLQSHPYGWQTYNVGADPTNSLTPESSEAFWPKPTIKDPSLTNLEYLWKYSRVNQPVWNSIQSLLNPNGKIVIISVRRNDDWTRKATYDNLSKQGVDFSKIDEMIFTDNSDKKLNIANKLGLQLMIEDKPSTLRQFYESNYDTAKVLRAYNIGVEANYRINPINGVITESSAKKMELISQELSVN